MSDTTEILNAIKHGESYPAEELLPQVYAELRRLAAYRLAHEPPGQTLQATALVHEAYLRLVRPGPGHWENQVHFFNAAAQAMRRILIESARRKHRLKHRAQMERVVLDETGIPSPMKPDELLALDDALEALAREDPQAARFIELRFFAGLGHQQAAEMIGITRRAADGLWAYARTWLFKEMRHAGVEMESLKVEPPKKEKQP